MNIETYHAIASQILEDVRNFDFPAKLRNLVNHLQNRINNPAEPSYTQNIDAQISELRTILPKLSSNSFPPLWQEYLNELGADFFVGNVLLAEIEEILLSNGITPTIAHKELLQISNEIDADLVSLQSSSDAMKRFHIGLDTPEPDTVELGVLVPRMAVHDGLAEFGAELRKLSRIFGVFHETIHGERPDLKLKSIASSDFSILCLIDWETAKLIAQSVSRLIESYKIILSLKEKIKGLLDDGIPEEKVQGLVDHANDQMAATVNAISEEIITRFPDGKVQETRRKELKIEMRGALGEIATRIDKGFSFEIRPGKVSPADDKDSGSAETQKLRTQQFAEISSVQEKLQYLKSDGSPVLKLSGLPPDKNDGGTPISAD